MSDRLLISGRVVLPDGDARQRYMLIQNGVIARISRSRPPEGLLGGAREVTTGPQDWIFPGLIDLHAHSDYNVLPLWGSPLAPFANRFAWRSDPAYKSQVKTRNDELKKLEPRAQAIIAELQAVAGGTTVLDRLPLDHADDEHRTLLCRDTGNARDIGRPAKVRSVVDFFRPDSGVPKETADVSKYEQDREQDSISGMLVHLAEGRSGFGTNRGVDAYSRAEFEAFRKLKCMVDVEKVRRIPFSLVHGCGIDTANSDHVSFLRERGISIVWSPTSNLLLYGDTLDVEPLLGAGINIALGSDWSPSGSKHVWEEAKFARAYLRAIGSHVSDADLFRMVTQCPARCLGTETLGRIAEGAAADFFIVRSPIESDSALEVFFGTDDEHVMATIIKGAPCYGEAGFLHAFGPGLSLKSLPDREGHVAKTKRVHLPGFDDVDLDAAMNTLEDRLKTLQREAHEYPIGRSNLLASSDTPYRRRIQSLRVETEQLGWSARRLAKHANATPGQIPVPPTAARLWCGFSGCKDRDDFMNQLRSTFIPGTVQLLRNLGLTAYFPAIPTVKKPDTCPDEVALVFYESAERYEHAKRTLAGRAYSLLHQSVFSFASPRRSWSNFPSPYDGTLASEHCYYLFDGEIDWYAGRARVLIGTRKTNQPATEFLARVAESLTAVQSAHPAHVDAAMVAVTDDYVVFWDHRNTDGDDAHLERLATVSDLVMRREAREVAVQAPLDAPFDGVQIDPDECLRLVFERRGLRFW